MKVLFVTNVPSPYRVKFFNELGKYCELTVLFEKKTSDERDASWKEYSFDTFKGVFLNGKSISVDMAYCPEIVSYVKEQQWDAVICSDFLSPTGMKLTGYLKRRHIPYMLESDGGFASSDSFLKKALKKKAIGGADFYLSTGKSHDDYYASYGAPRDKIIRYPFSSVSEKEILSAPVSAEDKKAFREKLGLTEQQVVLAVGQFIPRKGFDILLNAAKDISHEVGIYFVGGSPTEEYVRLKEQYHLDNVHFVGFKKPDELKKYYMAADVFVLPTREDIWGLVINEAMAFGLPIVTTDRCLAGVELIKDGENGFIVPVEDSKALADSLNRILSDSELIRLVNENNLKKAHDHTIESMVKAHIRLFVNTERN